MYCTTFYEAWACASYVVMLFLMCFYDGVLKENGMRSILTFLMVEAFMLDFC